jgi:hypothetical protein
MSELGKYQLPNGWAWATIPDLSGKAGIFIDGDWVENLDIFWLKNDVLEESANLPAPEVTAQEITDDLEAALEQCSTITEDLKK